VETTVIGRAAVPFIARGREAAEQRARSRSRGRRATSMSTESTQRPKAAEKHIFALFATFAFVRVF
jgi:hypothetical protein